MGRRTARESYKHICRTGHNRRGNPEGAPIIMADTLEAIHIGVTLLVAAISAFVGYIVLLIKNNQSTVKADLLEQQNKIRSELIENHQNIKRELDVHIADDEGKFNSVTLQFNTINNTLSKMDGKLDTITQRPQRRA